MSAGARVVLGAALAALAAVLAVTTAGASSSPPFEITHLVVPVFVKQNGPREPRKVFWEGNPTFPVTVYERGLCPESVNCGARDANGLWAKGAAAAVFPARANPLVSPNFYFCNGGATSNYVVGVEDWLTDARGHRTAPVRSFWACKTH